MKRFSKILIIVAAAALSTSALGEGVNKTKKFSRTSSVEPVNSALRTNYSQVVRAAQVRAGMNGDEGRIVRFEVEVPDQKAEDQRIIIRRGPAVKLMNP